MAREVMGIDLHLFHAILIGWTFENFFSASSQSDRTSGAFADGEQTMDKRHNAWSNNTYLLDRFSA